ncbi:TolB family protein [Plantactinospora sp. WMMB782]|uniref:TolB family protein n=1 Tax=Plantactinospora sp. WMMB782 TaxID=3404121 RepID=UPI003B9518BE
MKSRRTILVLAVVLGTAVATVGAGSPASAQNGKLTTVSVSYTGGQANDFTDAPAFSGNGRYVAFWGAASNLVPGDTNGEPDVFVRDRRTDTTTRVSLTNSGGQPNGASSRPAISQDGRYVGFLSAASNLVPGDTNGVEDVFVRDRSAGTTTRVSVASTAAQANGASRNVAISANGRYVAFDSDAANLVPGDTNDNQDVFLHDLRSGRTTRVSVSTTGVQSTGGSLAARISADGRVVAFWSTGSDLVPDDTNNGADVFVRDLRTGVTSRVSLTDGGTQPGGEIVGSFSPSLSADGRYVAFVSRGRDLVPGDTNFVEDVFVRDRVAGTTQRISVSSQGNQSDGSSYQPVLSADGRYVAFGSGGSNLVPGDSNGDQDVFVRDRFAGSTTLVSVSSTGVQANNSCVEVAMSPDGRFVGFGSYAWSLVPNDVNESTDVFVSRWAR